jgi:hypothetical protein
MQDRVFSNRSIVTISTMCAGPEFSNVANIGTRNPHIFKSFRPRRNLQFRHFQRFTSGNLRLEGSVTRLVVRYLLKCRISENEQALAPKGLHNSARGFNPGNRTKPQRALKGRQVRMAKNVNGKCNHRPWQGFSGAPSGRIG